LSLDKWLKPKKENKKKKEKSINGIDKKDEIEVISKVKNDSSVIPKIVEKIGQKEEKSELKDEKINTKIQIARFQKFILICPKKSCKFQKTKMIRSDRKLEEKDKICPRCKGQLKIKKV